MPLVSDESWRDEFLDEDELAVECAGFFDDPLGWVMWAFPWDTDPAIQLVKLEEPYASMYPNCEYGPDKWACEELEHLGKMIRERSFDGRKAVNAIQNAYASGHGIGKSTFSAWLILFIMSTRPYCKGVVTANTAPQLRTKTWAEVGKWHKKCMTRNWFEYNNGQNNMNLYHKLHPESWRVDGQTCREENSESFAGLHAANSTPFYIFDEASAVPDAIYEVADGGLTDGEPMLFLFGNPTRNQGRFRDAFAKLKHRFHTRKIDSRSVAITNKDKIAQWAEDYGEDSDWFKVRVKGDFPSASSMQLISSKYIELARVRDAVSFKHQPLLMGVDPAGTGNDKYVIRWRRGNDARTIPPLKWRNIEPMDFASEIASHYFGSYHTNGAKADVVFIDKGSGGHEIASRLRQLGVNVVEVDFGSKSTRPDCALKCDEIWLNMRDAMREGLAIDDDDELIEDLTWREYGYDKHNRYRISKKDDLPRSPDDGDALAVTWAEPVAPLDEQNVIGTQGAPEQEWDPHSV